MADDFATTIFLITPGTKTLPIAIYNDYISGDLRAAAPAVASSATSFCAAVAAREGRLLSLSTVDFVLIKGKVPRVVGIAECLPECLQTGDLK